jgi:hypothetical protein
MASAVDICNLALSHLGDEAQVASITPVDGTTQSAHCARYYPIARDVLLQMHAWSFAIKRTPLAELVDNPVGDDWAYAYSIPSSCLKPLSLLKPGVPERFLGAGTDADLGSHPYLVEAAESGSKILYTNIEGAYLRYVDGVSDTTRFPPLFVVALSRLLAAYLAGPIVKGDTGMRVSQAQLKWFELEFGKAAAADANVGKRNAYQQHRPGWLASRTLPTIPDGFVDRSA